MAPELFLEIKETQDGRGIQVKDTSRYIDILPVTCGIVRVFNPSSKKPIYFEVGKNFVFNIDMINMELQKDSNYVRLQVLPDGLYNIQYSINPNNELFVEYNFYNVYNLRRKYFEAVCDFLENKCDMNKKEQNQKIEHLWSISNNIDMIKNAAEECNNIDGANMLYNDTVSLLTESCCG